MKTVLFLTFLLTALPFPKTPEGVSVILSEQLLSTDAMSYSPKGINGRESLTNRARDIKLVRQSREPRSGTPQLP